MTEPWWSLLTSLPLSRTEREVAKRFEADPLGRTFLPVADILRSHRLVDESLELLAQGVARHPGFAVARVVLSRELLQKGAIVDSWQALEDSPVSLRDNLLAQKLRFRLALLLGAADLARSVYQQLKAQKLLDAELKRTGDLLEVAGFARARERLIAELRERGVEPVLPPLAADVEPTSMPPAPVGEGAGGRNAAPLARATAAEERALAATTQPPVRAPALSAPKGAPPSPYLRETWGDDDPALTGFHVVPLGEIFKGDSQTAGPREGHGGLELDSTTLADIYARQGHYSKALEVYRRLLRLTPHNDLLRRRVAELAQLAREQQEADLSVDATAVDRMETVEIIDRQIRFLNDVLAKL